MSTNFLLAGVGGQGVLVAADVVALMGLELGLDVKKSEVHGIAQRGGSVSSQVRWGRLVQSPLIRAGEVDYLIAFERLEALRYVDMLRPRAIALCSDYCASIVSGGRRYPTATDELEAYAGTLRYDIPVTRIARELRSTRVSNSILLGALSACMEAPEDVWRRVIALRVPAPLVALNQEAFAAGRAALALSSRTADTQLLVVASGK